MSDLGYQSLYIDQHAENIQDKIVFHDPIFDEEIAGVTALKCLRLEKSPGLVLSGSKSALRSYRKAVSDADYSGKLGKMDDIGIVSTLAKMASGYNITITYHQNVDHEARFFDALTKKNLIDQGPGYFDPSLPTYKSKAAMVKAEYNIDERKLYSRICSAKHVAEMDISRIKAARSSLWNSESRHTFSRKVFSALNTKETRTVLKTQGYAMNTSNQHIKKLQSYDIVVSELSPGSWKMSVVFKDLPQSLFGPTSKLFRYGNHRFAERSTCNPPDFK